ncbi:hypothetical protein ZHAS_00019491 [Anopheles sinensis]|uniref:THAP-type domain-containing protein n=1 Tax=Anopheles sinensis TaxID=74873 RepID=A0A084WLY1_ANOSI|nr:hypothetical protein ZHAS_00019491 [Anopheles sinensis]
MTSTFQRWRNVRACMVCQNRSSVTDKQPVDPLQRITYHRLTMNVERRDRWLEFCGITKDSCASLNHKFICSDHFEAECFERDLRSELLDGIKRMVLKKDAIPTIRSKEQQQLPRNHGSEPKDDEAERNRRKAEVEILLSGDTANETPIVNPFRKHVCKERPSAKRQASPLLSNYPDGSKLPRVLGPSSETDLLQRIMQLEQVTNEQSKLIEQLQRTIDQKTEKINFAKAEMVNIAIALQDMKDHENRHVSDRVAQLLSGRFSEGQLAAITTDATGTSQQSFWTDDDLMKALELRGISEEAFRYVVQRLNYPLPDAAQIERWIHSVYLETGSNRKAFRLLELHAASLSRQKLICTLNISCTDSPVRYHYDVARDQIIGPDAQLHCITVQGIFSDWIQLVHVDFDINYSQQLVAEMLSKLHRIGYHVVAITTACDRYAASMWTELGACYDQHLIRHPVTSDNVYVYVCPDSTLNAIHRILLTDGFMMQQTNVMITKDNVLITLARLMESVHMRTGRTLTIDQRHLDSENLDNPFDTCLSRQLISHETSSALKMLAHDSGDDDTLATLGTLFEIFTDWYELCTSAAHASWKDQQQQQPPSITCLPYGSNEDEQNIILDAMYDVMENFRCTTADNNFLREGVLMSINSMRRLLADLRRDYPGRISSIPMERLGSSPVRAAMVNLRCALRNATAGTGLLTGNEVLVHLCNSILNDGQHSHISNRMLQLNGLPMIPLTESVRSKDERNELDVRGITEQNVCSYLTKHIAVSLLHKYDYLGEQIIELDRSNDQYIVRQDSKKMIDALVPSALWTEQAKVLEFYLNDGVVQQRTPSLVENLVNRILDQHPRMGRDLVEMYVRKRIAIQLHLLNVELGVPSIE